MNGKEAETKVVRDWRRRNVSKRNFTKVSHVNAADGGTICAPLLQTIQIRTQLAEVCSDVVKSFLRSAHSSSYFIQLFFYIEGSFRTFPTEVVFYLLFNDKAKIDVTEDWN